MITKNLVVLPNYFYRIMVIKEFLFLLLKFLTELSKNIQVIRKRIQYE